MFRYSLRLGAALTTGLLVTGAAIAATGPIKPHVVTGGGAAVHQAHPLTNPTARAILVGGGATLPALAYMGPFPTASGAPVKFLAKPSDAKSVFGYFDSSDKLTVQYCQTGSGYGKTVLNGAANAANPVTAIGQEAVNLTCTNGSPVAGTNGFQGPQTGTGFPLTDPDFAGSDSPITQTDYTNFTTYKHTDHNTIQPDRGEAVQVPFVVGSVALLYNNPDLANKQISLSASQLCNIFNGTYTNWSQLGYKSRPLTFVYRSDGSGTTFSFSNYLVKATSCKVGTAALSVSQTWAGSTPVVVESPVPSNSASASGNGNVTSCIVSNTSCATGTGGAGTIGYVETANAKAALNAASGIEYATIGGKDPVKNLPEAANKLANTIDVDKVVQFNQGGLATAVALTTAPTTAGCLTFVDPGAYNAIGTGYPIVAVSNLDFGQKANGSTNSANLQKLAKIQFASTATVYNNKYVIGGTSASSNAIVIDSIDAATASTGTGTTGYSTLPLVYSPSTNTVVSKAIGCIGA
ncbi:MAG: substrate-binding domain-containing protein [Candidatus Eremiobacteraeota bacterium]|nr:substrate-binding domain-containing protein [Candidatus Eremiobacteraeota bacterium]